MWFSLQWNNWHAPCNLCNGAKENLVAANTFQLQKIRLWHLELFISLTRQIQNTYRKARFSSTIKILTPSTNDASDIYAKTSYYGVNAKYVVLGACLIISFVVENIINKHISKRI